MVKQLKSLCKIDLNSIGCVITRWWKCKPARRDVSQRQTSSGVQKEENDRAGLGGSPAEPDLQDPAGTENCSAPVTPFIQISV